MHLLQIEPIARTDIEHPFSRCVSDETEELRMADVSLLLQGLGQIVQGDLVVTLEISLVLVVFVLRQHEGDPIADLVAAATPWTRQTISV